MARIAAPNNLSQLFSIRVGNIPPEISTEQVYEDFSKYGKIGDFYRPTHLQHCKPSRFCFVRYFNKDDANRAIIEMNGKVYGDRIINVDDANLQDSFFTQDTGYITNSRFDTPQFKPQGFDSSLPESHYPMKRKEELKNLDNLYTLRIDDLPTQITKEKLEEIFSEFGEVCSVYLPMDLKNHVHRGFAFVRYSHEGTAKLAAKNMDNTHLGIGDRNIRVSGVKSSSYFSQDESHTAKVYDPFH